MACFYLLIQIFFKFHMLDLQYLYCILSVYFLCIESIACALYSQFLSLLAVTWEYNLLAFFFFSFVFLILAMWGMCFICLSHCLFFWVFFLLTSVYWHAFFSLLFVCLFVKDQELTVWIRYD